MTVWHLSRSAHPQAKAAREVLVRLSGRQMKHRQAFTLPALLAGMWVLLAMIEVLESYSLDDLRDLAALALPDPTSQPP